MSDEDIFSEFNENKPEESVKEVETTLPEEEKTVVQPNEDSNVVPSEVIAEKGNPYSQLSEDQKIILGDMANSYSIDIGEVIKEFNRAHLDKSLIQFSDKERKFNMAKAIMKNILDEKAKVKTFVATPIGANVFYAPKSNQVISNLVALMQYEVEDKKTGAVTIVKKRKVIKSFDKAGESNYQSLHKMIPFYSYDLMLKRDKKDEFTLSEFSSFEHGSQPEGNLANLTDLEIYKGLKIIPQESIQSAGMSKLPEDSEYPYATDLKALYVICEPFSSYNPPKDFKDVVSMSTKAIDYEGVSMVLRLPALPGFVTMVSEFPKGERITGIGIGTLHENPKTGDIIFTIYNFFPSSEEEE